IASFVADLIMVGIGALAASAASAGASLAAGAAWAVSQACQLATKIANRIGQLLDDLAGLAGSLGRTCGRLDQVADAVTRGAERLGTGSSGPSLFRRMAVEDNPLGMPPAVVNAADRVERTAGPKVLVETGKEDAKADAELRGWRASQPAGGDPFGRYPTG
ncbi:hypothetical protein ACFQE5_17410, partial [Pseudonocardia hispaniensis]